MNELGCEKPQNLRGWPKTIPHIPEYIDSTQYCGVKIKRVYE